MELRHSSCKCNNHGNYVKSCCFNPVIFFICKLCRGTFENADKLILHKRQHHSLKDLKGVKFIIFEERFVETDESKIRNELKSTLVEHEREIRNETTDVDIHSDPHLHATDTDTDSAADIDDVIRISDESEKFKLINLYVHLKRLTSKEIKKYSIPTAAANHKQDGAGFKVNDHDNRCDINGKQNTLCRKPIVAFDPKIITNRSNSGSNENVSADLTRTLPKNQCENVVPELLDEGEFIVANVVQSSDGIGKVQFLTASTRATPVTPETASITLHLDSRVVENITVGEQYENEIGLIKTESESEPLVDDAQLSPVPCSSETEDHVPLSATKANPDTKTHSQEAAVSVEINSPTMCASSELKTLTQGRVSPPSNASRASARLLRNRSKINYSENQTCAKCSRDFYTVEELETHEKVCLKNKTNRKQEQLGKRSSTLMTFSDRAQPTHDDSNDNDKIQVIQTAAISPNPNDLEVKVTDNEGDLDYECPDVISGSSDIEFESSTVELNISKNKIADKNNDMENKNNFHVIQRKVTETGKPENYTDFSLELKDWIMKEKEANPENIIMLDPDPFQTEADTNEEVNPAKESPAFVATPENPMKCKLCSKGLTSDLEAKLHVKRCWIKNKTKHVHCPMCSKSYANPSGLHRHRKVKHLKPGETSLSFKCTICSKELATQVGFKLHMEVHKNPNLKPFVCEICGSGFRKKFKLQHHQLSHSEDRPFKCKLCPKAFKNKQVLRNHRAVHVKDTNYHCLPCNKSFKTKNLLQRHSFYHLIDKWFPCKAEHCGFKFPNKLSLLRHCKKDHRELFTRLAKWSCTVCNEKFMFNCQLKRHMISHGGEKPFKCLAEGCDGSFSTKQNLDEHSRKHTAERSFQCDTCGSTFWKLASFQKHIKAHNNPPDKILCHLCPRKFPHNYELQQHLIFHEKGKQFKCDTCGFKCMTKANLKGHMKTHERNGDTGIGSSSDSEPDTEEDTTEESGSDSEKEVEKTT